MIAGESSNKLLFLSTIGCSFFLVHQLWNQDDQKPWHILCLHLVSATKLCNISGIAHFTCFQSRDSIEHDHPAKVACLSELSARPVYCNPNSGSLACDNIVPPSVPSSLQLLVTPPCEENQRSHQMSKRCTVLVGNACTRFRCRIACSTKSP